MQMAHVRSVPPPLGPRGLLDPLECESLRAASASSSCRAGGREGQGVRQGS